MLVIPDVPGFLMRYHRPDTAPLLSSCLADGQEWVPSALPSSYGLAFYPGVPQRVDDPAEKPAAKCDFTERLVSGRWDTLHPPTSHEINHRYPGDAAHQGLGQAARRGA